MNPNCLLLVVGTRPEVIKMAPVYLEAKRHFPETQLLFTGQHGDMALKAMRTFGIAPDSTLSTLRIGDTLTQMTARLVSELDTYLNRISPACVLVQGDTTSAALSGLMAFYRHLPVAHVEAGLRSFDKTQPFPEEVNRKIIGTYADLHFAPTHRAASNLLAEGVPKDSILVCGNTVVDAAELMRNHLTSGGKKYRRLLVTMHRRESWSHAIEHICRALRTLIERNPDIDLLIPVHHNPIVSKQVHRYLSGMERVLLSEPLGYLELQQALHDSYLVLTDSGGIQEEAPCYGVPVLVLRKVTERPEAVEQGQAVVVGTNEDDILRECQLLLDDSQRYQRMASCKNPFGDGKASPRIIHAIQRHIAGDPVLTGPQGEFDPCSG